MGSWSEAEAKDKELLNWIENYLFESVENLGQCAISVRWVITEKIKGREKVTKAHLVARGYEENKQDLQTNSPTCSREAVRTLLAVASSNQWNCHTVDVQAAYLQGDEINRNIYLKPPKEYDEGQLWILRKTVYGLCDAARAWYLRVQGEMESLC